MPLVQLLTMACRVTQATRKPSNISKFLCFKPYLLFVISGDIGEYGGVDTASDSACKK